MPLISTVAPATGLPLRESVTFPKEGAVCAVTDEWMMNRAIPHKQKAEMVVLMYN
jgi:hypothetical protein